ncbi:MAG: hypothetical protein CBD88_01005 [Flavobacteriales bacterium TMED228]|nr:MAG: hypothetical protein CBD88_01005 [Flavobacteriales bacterium TMED228]|tara:strand:+ start:15270 stop:15479 length:210 start_codon:yes stop_codon:yes gene_type:complete
MEISSISNTPLVSWQKIAFQKQESLRTGGEGKVIKEIVESIEPLLYLQKDGKVEVQKLPSSHRIINLLV